MATKNVVPNADSEGQIGTSAKQWSNGYFDELNVTTLTADSFSGNLSSALNARSFAGGVRFDGVSGFGTFDSISFDGAFTLTAKINNADPSNPHAILGSDSGSADDYIIFYTASSLRFVIGGVNKSVGISPALTENTDYQFTFIRDDSGNFYIYVDGELRGSRTSGDAGGTVGYGAIGNSRLNSPLREWDGVISDFALFNTDLTAAQVADLATLGLEGFRAKYPELGTGVYIEGSGFSFNQASDAGSASASRFNFTSSSTFGRQAISTSGTSVKTGDTVKVTLSNVTLPASDCEIEIRTSAGSFASNRIVITGNGDYLLVPTADLNNFQITVRTNSSGDTFDGEVDSIDILGSVAAYTLNEGIGRQIRDISGNANDALLSLTGFEHLATKDEGRVRVKAADASSAAYMIQAADIIPEDCVVTEIVAEERLVATTNSAQTLNDNRIRLNPSGSDLQMQRSDGSNHQTLGTVTAPTSLSDVDVDITYRKVAR